MFRITAGKFKGKKLILPPDHITRPTSTRAREALFSILFSMGIRLEESAFLDGFAGSGAVGIEALSRGAKHVTFVENHNRVQKILRDNLKNLSGANNWELFTNFESTKQKLDIVFLDPPYFLQIEQKPAYQSALEKLQDHMDADTLVIIETDATENISINNFNLIEAKTYGIAKFWFLWKKS